VSLITSHLFLLSLSLSYTQYSCVPYDSCIIIVKFRAQTAQKTPPPS
jgi:hypothetical protein